MNYIAKIIKDQIKAWIYIHKHRQLLSALLNAYDNEFYYDLPNLEADKADKVAKEIGWLSCIVAFLSLPFFFFRI